MVILALPLCGFQRLGTQVRVIGRLILVERVVTRVLSFSLIRRRATLLSSLIILYLREVNPIKFHSLNDDFFREVAVVG